MAQKKEENNHKNSGHFVLQPRQRAAHTLRSDQNQVNFDLLVFNLSLLCLHPSFRGLCKQDPPLSHPLTWAEIFRHTCLQSCLQTSPPTPKKSYTKFQNPWKCRPLVYPKSAYCRGKGGPLFFIFIGILIFLCKISKHDRACKPLRPICFKYEINVRLPALCKTYC